MPQCRERLQHPYNDRSAFGCSLASTTRSRRVAFWLTVARVTTVFGSIVFCSWIWAFPSPKAPEPAGGWAGSGYILGAIGCAYACRSPPRTKPRCAGLVPKGSLSLTRMQNSAFLFIHLLTFLRKLCIFFLGWSKDPGPSTGEEVPRFFCGEMLLEGTKCIY